MTVQYVYTVPDYGQSPAHNDFRSMSLFII